MALFDFDKDSILWFIILFLLLFWCGNGCDGHIGGGSDNDCGCRNECC